MNFEMFELFRHQMQMIVKLKLMSFWNTYKFVNPVRTNEIVKINSVPIVETRSRTSTDL